MSAWHRTSEKLPDDEMEVLGYYEKEDRHRIVYCLSDFDKRTRVSWFSANASWPANSPDFWRGLDVPEDEEPQRPGVHYAGDGHTEPYEYMDAPRDDTDERVDDAMAEQLFEEGEQHGS